VAFSSIQHTSWCLRVLFVKINLTTNLRNNIKIRTKVYRLFPDAVLSKDLGINWHLYPFHKCRGFLKLSGRCKTIPQWVCTAAQKNKSDTITYFLNSIQNTITEKGMIHSTNTGGFWNFLEDVRLYHSGFALPLRKTKVIPLPTF